MILFVWFWVWSGLVWSGLVWSGLVWSGLVWSGLLFRRRLGLWVAENLHGCPVVRPDILEWIDHFLTPLYHRHTACRCLMIGYRSAQCHKKINDHNILWCMLLETTIYCCGHLARRETGAHRRPSSPIGAHRRPSATIGAAEGDRGPPARGDLPGRPHVYRGVHFAKNHLLRPCITLLGDTGSQ
jgi:hypothetical protein